MSILLPLYVYPWPGVWDPLYWMANTYPNLNFTVIVNPCSGPCVDSSPEQAYLDEMPRLKDWPNIRTLGYVATNYTNRPLETILEEIDIYANWTTTLNNTKVAVDGIFFDETPGAYDWRYHDYLQTATERVKSSEGLGSRVVVHNPGTLPYTPWNYLDLADITVVFEETFAKYIDATTFHGIAALPQAANLPKDRFAVMLHSVPDIPEELVQWLAGQLERTVGWAFVTSIGERGEYWHQFSALFEPFVRNFAEAGGKGEAR